MEFCCTCAVALPDTRQHVTSEKPLPEDRRLACCERVICGSCIHENRRFAQYCPYCQISSAPSALPQRLRDPPTYTSLPASNSQTTDESPAPPPYASKAPPAAASKTGHVLDDEKAALAATEDKPAEDILHFLNHDQDSIASLSLRYGVPAAALRRSNNIAADHLLLGRRTILIPGEFYKGGVSLSPRPIEGEEEELRKSKIRRFMTACKVSDYDEALLYLEQTGYDLSAATEAYFDDEAWERAHPKSDDAKAGNKAKRPQRDRGPFWRGLEDAP